MKMTKPDDMTSEQRTAELAALLAQGVLRLRKRAIRSPQGGSCKSSKIDDNGVENSRETVLTVHTS